MNDSDHSAGENELLDGETVEVHADAWDEEDPPSVHANPFTVQRPLAVNEAIQNGLRQLTVSEARPSLAPGPSHRPISTPPLPDYNDGMRLCEVWPNLKNLKITSLTTIRW